MRCKSSNFYATDQIFFVLLRQQITYLHFYMKRYIKYLGIADIILGLLLFALHVILQFNGNELLFGGLVLVLSGVIIFVRGERLASFQSSKKREKED